MTMYVTKTWGFDPARWPLVTFSLSGVREKLRAAYRAGDAMLIVATLGPEVEEEERGRILGFFEFTDVAATTRDVVDPALLAEHGDRWQYGLVVRRAWRLSDAPLFKKVLPSAAHRFRGRLLAANYGRLTDEEEWIIRTLPCQEETLAQTAVVRRASVQSSLQAALLGRRGPAPSHGAYEGARTEQNAVTYLLERQSSQPSSPQTARLMKVGWAHNPDERAATLSEPLVPSLSGERWAVALKKPWRTERAAYAMEQAFLACLDKHRVRRSSEYFLAPMRKQEIEARWWLEAMLYGQQEES